MSLLATYSRLAKRVGQIRLVNERVRAISFMHHSGRH